MCDDTIHRSIRHRILLWEFTSVHGMQSSKVNVGSNVSKTKTFANVFLRKNENMCTAQKAAASHLSTTIFSPFRMTSSSVHHLPPLALEMRLQRVQSKYAFLLGEKGKITPDVLLHEIVKNNNIAESFEHEDMELCLKTVGFGKDPDTENNNIIESICYQKSMQPKRTSRTNT